MMHVRPTKWFLRFLSMAFASAVIVILWITPVQPSLWREQVIPILGVTLDDRHISGAVATVRVSFAERLDHSGLAMHFLNAPDRFSPMAQTAIEQAVYR